MAARRLYAERPGAPLYEVARVAGVGQATLYRHFPDRPALIGTLAREALDDLVNQLHRGDAPPLARAERLALVTQALAASHPLLETLRGALATAPATREEPARGVVARLRDAVMGAPAGSAPVAGNRDDGEIVLAMLCGALDDPGADPAQRARIARRVAQIADLAIDAMLRHGPRDPGSDADQH